MRPSLLLLTTFFTLGLLLGTPSRGQAQDEDAPVTPPPEQLKLLKEAVRATNKGQFEQAINLYEAAMPYGDLNIIHLGLGRLLQRQGRCMEAERHFEQALVAPAVQKPGRKGVASAIARYRQQNQELCPATLIITCIPGSMTLSVSGQKRLCGEPMELDAGEYEVLGQAFGKVSREKIKLNKGQRQTLKMEIQQPMGSLTVNCKDPNTQLRLEGRPLLCGQETLLPAGEHKITARLDDQKQAHTIIVGEGNHASLALELIIQPPAPIEKAPAPTPKPKPRSHARQITSWSLIGAGTLSLGVGAWSSFQIQDINQQVNTLGSQVVLSSRDSQRLKSLRSDADLYNGLQYAGFGLGLASITVGTVLLLLPQEDKEPPATAGWGVTPLHSGAGVWAWWRL